MKSSLNKWAGILFLCLSWGLFRVLFESSVPAAERLVSVPLLTSLVIAAFAIQAYFRNVMRIETSAKRSVAVPVVTIGTAVLLDTVIILFAESLRQSRAGILLLYLVHAAGGFFLLGAVLRFLVSQLVVMGRSRFSFPLVYIFLISFLVFALIICGIIGTASRSEILIRIYAIGFTGVSVFVFLLSRIHPDILQSAGRTAVSVRYARTSLTGVDMNSLKIRLRRLMEDEKIYLDENCNLDKVAGLLKLSRHQLSEFLNRDLDTGFSAYVNGFRIKKVIELLKTSAETSILEAAFAAGFNSKSSFNEAFRRETGMTPREFRKKSVDL